jgi:hypothetical protein
MLERAAIAAARRNGAALWYLGRDLSSVFGDANGTTAPALSGLAGLLLDRSYGLAGAVGPELAANGGFTSDYSGWAAITGNTGAVVATSGALQVTRTGQYVGVQQQIAVQAGRTYRLSFQSSRASGSGVPVLRLRSDADTVGVVLAEVVGSMTGSMIEYSGTYAAASSATLYLQVAISNADAVCSFDNVSVREISTSTLGAELLTNGDLASGSVSPFTAENSATLAVVGGELEVTNPDGLANRQGVVSIFPSITAGRTYRLTVRARRGTATSYQVGVEGNSQSYTFSGGLTNTASATYTVFFTPIVGQTACVVRLRVNGAGTAYFDDVSVREVLGVHAAQAMAGSRPTIVQLPSGYYGLSFDGTDDFLGAPAPAATPSKEVIIGAASSTVASEVRAIAGRRVATTSGCLVRTNANRYEAVGIVSNSPFGLADSATVIASDVPSVVDVDFTSTTLSIQVNGGTRYPGNAAVTLAPNTAKVGIGSFSGDGFAQGWKGTIALVAWAPNEIPEADRIPIKRFAALLSGAPYTG